MAKKSICEETFKPNCGVNNRLRYASKGVNRSVMNGTTILLRVFLNQNNQFSKHGWPLENSELQSY